ncbi:hypothetical protein BMF94_5067 [Rhodotorula taiwanensis]|uniref:Xylanolytic transcriptional activator regulatory domain-containing protein n=1 Tax=Rhodotorula taiwanensis TaxID=741276 RepID=A0A2S5B556_9BASI|nr:hypothetical protein BMF94_5067 [Rhodotorula taiwanensis]
MSPNPYAAPLQHHPHPGYAIAGGSDASSIMIHDESTSASPPYDDEYGDGGDGNGSSRSRSTKKPTKGIGRGRETQSKVYAERQGDGVQPQCGVCIATAIRSGHDPSLVVCDFPTEEERRKPVGGGKVYALEAKIQALERKLADAERRAAGGYVPSPRATPVPSTQGMPQIPLRLDDGQVRASPQPRPQTAASLTETKPMIGPERTPRSRHASVGGQPYLPSGEPLRPLYLAHLETGVGPPSAAASTSSAGASTSYAGFALASATKSNVASPFTHHPPYLAEVPGSASTGPVSAAPSFAFPQAHLEPPSPSGQTNGYSGKGILSGHPAFGASPTYALMGPVSHPISTGPSEPAPFSDPPPLGSPAIQMSGAAPPHRMGPSATTGAPVAATVPSGPRLPSYSTLSRLVNVFFDYPHEAIDLINRRRFMAAFECPPDHPEYPAECLLHAMVATATDLAGLDAWEGEERYWNEGQSPAVFHADLAEYLLPLGFRTERNLLQVAQAAVLFACLNLYHGRFSRAYIDTSIAVRICTSLGLNHNVFLPNHLPLSSFLAHRTALPPPADEEEARERSVTWWFAYTVETFSAAATGWACCIDERDITTLVPAAGPVGDDPIAREALYLHSPSFFITNPPHLVRLVQINLKVTVLLNRVCTFVSRTTALANATPDRSALKPSEFPKIRSSPAFTKLEAALENFGRKAPAQLVALLEPEAFLCPSLVATSVILLHERFCTSEHNDPSMIKCLEAANSILQNMQVLNNASFHPRQIPPFLSFCWTVAARTYLRQLAIRQLKGMPPVHLGDASLGNGHNGGTPTLEDEVRHLTQIVTSIIARLEHFRTPVGPLMAASLVSLLDRPDICLPEADRAQVDRSGQTAIANLTSVMSSVAPAAVNV